MRLIALLGALSLAGCSAQPQPAAAKPKLALLTSLPIVFGEGFTLDAPRNALLTALEEEYEVVPVDGPEQLPSRGLLLAIQPQALIAERLVGLDDWVKAGGRLVLLADPRLEWDSSRPLGDKFRPPFDYPDTGLLRHWGLQLTAPASAGPDSRELGGTRIAVVSAGSLKPVDRQCDVSRDNFVADCRIGRGRVTVVADADWVLTGAGAVDVSEAEKSYPKLIALLGDR